METVEERSSRPALPFLSGGGAAGALIRAHDWSATPLGDPLTWPQSLRSMVAACINSPLLSCVLWGPDFLFLYNDTYAASLADRHPAALGRPVAEVWGKAWDAVKPPFLRLLETGEGFSREGVRLEFERNGALEATWWDIAAAPIRGEDGSVVGILNQGVETTRQVLALEALQRSRAELHDLNRTLEGRVEERTQERDRIWRVSQDMLLVIGRDGVIQSVNPAWTRTLGYEEGELVGRRFDAFVEPGDTGPSFAAVDHAPTGVFPAFENRWRHKDGSLRHLSWTAAPSGDRIYCVARDVTQEKERAAALRRYENIVQSDSAPICAFDTDFRLIAFNPAHNDEFFRVNGFYTRIGDVFPDLFIPDQAPVMRALMARALAGEAFTVVEEFGKPALGKPSWEISYTPLRDAAGRIVGAFHHAVDISARLRAEAELEVVQDALRQSQKMEAVGQLTGGLAHDFNNLLAGISGSLELMQRRIAEGRVHDVERYLLAAQGASKRAAALTHRLLAFSRRQTLAPRPTDVNRLVAGMEELVRRTVGPEIAVETVAENGLWSTLVDPNQLENALLNLCINARDAMAEGGTLRIDTGNRCLDDMAAKQHDLPRGQYVSMCVSDNGTGMPPDVVAKAFDPFFTTKPIGVGTGLGLSMIYGFARQSGGQVGIASEVGRGTTVCLYLPRHIGDAEAAADGTDAAAASQATAGETVLVVDDEPLVRMLIVDVLEDLGYVAIEAGDGPGGLTVLRSDTRIDLLITDVGLPNGMNGRQVADAARALRPGLKVLFVTGYAENAVFNHEHLGHGMQVVTKPFEMSVLSERIRDLIAGG